MKILTLSSAACMVTVMAASAIFAARAQTSQPNGVASPSFEVASIKPDAEPGMGMYGGDPGTFRATKISVEFLLMTAFNIKPFQISGEPKWAQSERFDIDAKMDDATTEKMKAMTPDERLARTRLMLQSLLADRFKLVTHHTATELPVFSLVVSKSGRLVVSQKVCGGPSAPPSPQPGKWPEVSCGGLFAAFGHVAGDNIPIDRLVSALATFTGQTVEDNTGLKGKYDIELDWTPDPGTAPPPPPGSSFPEPDPGTAPPPPPGSSFPEPDPDGPSLQAALEEQLGLKLVSTRGPVDIIVIDHIEEPSAN